jgi:hypothetical protein
MLIIDSRLMQAHTGIPAGMRDKCFPAGMRCISRSEKPFSQACRLYLDTAGLLSYLDTAVSIYSRHEPQLPCRQELYLSFREALLSCLQAASRYSGGSCSS